MHSSPSYKNYIGMTKNSLNQRVLNGHGYKKCPRFWNAIKKYGWKNFNSYILFENLTYEEACNLERICIELFRTRNPKYGYNIGEGGIGCTNPDNRKKVYSYTVLGKFIKEYKSITDAAKELDIQISVVSMNCKENKQDSSYKKTVKNIILSFEKLDKEEYFKENILKHDRTISKKNFTLYYCLGCGELRACRKNRLCKECFDKTLPKKPSKELLNNLIYQHTFVDIGKMFNVSDNTIKRWCKNYGLPYKSTMILKNG